MEAWNQFKEMSRFLKDKFDMQNVSLVCFTDELDVLVNCLTVGVHLINAFSACYNMESRVPRGTKNPPKKNRF